MGRPCDYDGVEASQPITVGRPGRESRPRLLGLALIGVLAIMVGGLRAAERSDSSRPGAGGPHGLSGTDPHRETTVIHVRPVDDQGRLRTGFTVTDTVQDAKCYAGGSVKVAGAQSCVAGEYIYDPCWTETDGPSGPTGRLHGRAMDGEGRAAPDGNEQLSGTFGIGRRWVTLVR